MYISPNVWGSFCSIQMETKGTPLASATLSLGSWDPLFSALQLWAFSDSDPASHQLLVWQLGACGDRTPSSSVAAPGDSQRGAPPARGFCKELPNSQPQLCGLSPSHTSDVLLSPCSLQHLLLATLCNSAAFQLLHLLSSLCLWQKPQVGTQTGLYQGLDCYIRRAAPQREESQLLFTQSHSCSSCHGCGWCSSLTRLRTAVTDLEQVWVGGGVTWGSSEVVMAKAWPLELPWLKHHLPEKSLSWSSGHDSCGSSRD
jgi:hypothetical protein